MAAGPWDIVGDVIGAGVTLYEGEKNREAAEDLQERKERAIRRAADEANVSFDQMKRMLDEYDRGRIRLADDTMVQQYKDLMTSYEPQTYDFGKFGEGEWQYNKTVEDFLNPEAEKIAQLAGLQTQADLAGQGAAKGTGAMANMGYSRWKAAEDLYKDAQQAYNTDRSQAYSEYGDYIDRMQKKLNIISQGQLQKAQLLGGAVQNEQQAQSDYIADLLGIMGDKASTNVNATLGAF